jgi:hypothetical protein
MDTGMGKGDKRHPPAVSYFNSCVWCVVCFAGFTGGSSVPSAPRCPIQEGLRQSHKLGFLACRDIQHSSLQVTCLCAGSAQTPPTIFPAALQ